MISVCILTKNAKATLAKTLDSLKNFPEVIILDTGSQDETLQIAKRYPNTVIYETVFTRFGTLRNLAAEKAKYDWILALDSDEVLSPSLEKEIFALSLDPQMAYRMPRHNFYNGKKINGCGWSPDFVTRLYHRKNTSFPDAHVHESLTAKKQITLKSPILHTPYRSTAEFLHKMQQYSTLFAEQHKHSKRSSFAKAMNHALFAFVRSYFLQKGIFDGKEGFIISYYNANTTFYKYLKLAEETLA